MKVARALTASGLALVAGIAACASSGSSNDAEPAAAGSAGSAAESANDAGAEAAVDGGEVEQVDASTSCSDLFTLARQQLDSATACDLSVSSGQCAGMVATTCGCSVAVDSQSSVATESYSNTLRVIQAKACVVMCPPEFCAAPGPALCVQQSGGPGGVCVQRR
jgi:hypothetical protein